MYMNLNFWPCNVLDPMIIDVIIVHEEPCSSLVDDLYAASAGGTTIETVMERWMIQYESPQGLAPHSGVSSASYKKTQKKLLILLRSLYSQMSLLPAYGIFWQLCSSSQNSDFDIIYKVPSFCKPFSGADEETMKEYKFVPVDALPGCLSVSVTYHPNLSNFNLAPMSTFPPRIITDYVGSPTTDPLRSFPSSEKGVCAMSFTLRGIRPPVSAPLQCPHSWTSGFHKAAPFMMNQQASGSPPAYHMSFMRYDSPSPPTSTYGHRIHNGRLQNCHKATSNDELAPPFSSSISPSTQKHLSNFNPAQNHSMSETAPVTIPLPSTGRTSIYLSPNFSDPNRHSLPPLCPISTKHDSSSQESPSAICSIRKPEGLRAGELNSGMTNHSSSNKVFRDSRDDSGRFSGLLSSSGPLCIGFSRSSSRPSLQDDLDDYDFSCPFTVDDVDVSISHSSQNPDGNKISESKGKKSLDAAVGILVHMLRTAPPLCQDSSCYSSQSLQTDQDGGVATASGFFMPRKTSDALEELGGYRQIKDLLLSKSGTRIITKEEA